MVHFFPLTPLRKIPPSSAFCCEETFSCTDYLIEPPQKQKGRTMCKRQNPFQAKTNTTLLENVAIFCDGKKKVRTEMESFVQNVT